MLHAPSALHDPARLETLRLTGLLDAPPEPALERLSRLAARLLGAPAAVVTLVDADRQFFASCLGLPEPWQSARETPLSHSFCQHVMAADAPLVVGDARTHPTVRENLAIRDLRIVAYLGVPLRAADGQALGALAVIDGRPRAWTDGDRELLEDLAASVETEIALRAEVRHGLEATDALRASETRFRDFVESAHEGVWAVDVVGSTTYVNPPMAEMLGYTVDAMLGRELFGFMDPAGAFEARTRFARRQRGIAERHEFRWRHADGHEVVTTVSASPLHAPDGAFAGALAFVSDVTEQRHAEAALRDSQAGLGLALSAAGMVVWERDLQTERLRNLVAQPDEAASAARPNAFGTFAAFLAAVHPEDRDRIARTHREAVARGGDFSHQFRITGQQGQLRWLQSTGRVLLSDDGSPARVIGVSLDVTERVALEAQLRQAQKMEAVGQLAGGVAHDFNNLLTVITAATRFARESLPPDNPAGEDLAAIDAAAARAAQLTRQLLAFSRKQLLKPERLDVSRVAREAEQMLRRLIGADVEIVADLAPGLPLVLADPGQLEQVLINLAVNARDAMPDGGRLTFRTALVTLTSADGAARGGVTLAAGTYVRLSVLDTGTGMDAETLAHLFEPFFTTKAPGRGTGLGLATVYGIVKQSGGYVWVTSAPGAGTTIEIDLPTVGPALAAAAASPDAGVGRRTPSAQAGETLLLVEDDVAVRAVTRRILVRHGYTVLEAAHGAAALEVLERQERQERRVDLVLTDVVMPQMSGRAFAEALVRRWPRVRVLFMSGYTDDEILRRGVLTPGVTLLEKPFTAERLLEAVRDSIQVRVGALP